MCFCHHICHQNCHYHHDLINCHHNCHQNHNFTRVTGTGTCASARRTSVTLLLLRSEPALSLSLLLSSSADPSEWSRLGHGWGRERERGGRVQLCSCSDRTHQSCLLPCNPCSCLPQLILVREVDKDMDQDENKNEEWEPVLSPPLQPLLLPSSSAAGPRCSEKWEEFSAQPGTVTSSQASELR